MFKKVKNLVLGHIAEMEMGKNKAGTLSLTLKKILVTASPFYPLL